MGFWDSKPSSGGGGFWDSHPSNDNQNYTPKQLNAFKTVYNLSSTKERQNLLKTTQGSQLHDAIANIGVNSKFKAFDDKQSFGNKLYNGAATTGSAIEGVANYPVKTAYNTLIKPVAQQAANLGKGFITEGSGNSAEQALRNGNKDQIKAEAAKSKELNKHSTNRELANNAGQVGVAVGSLGSGAFFKGAAGLGGRLVESGINNGIVGALQGGVQAYADKKNVGLGALGGATQQAATGVALTGAGGLIAKAATQAAPVIAKELKNAGKYAANERGGGDLGAKIGGKDEQAIKTTPDTKTRGLTKGIQGSDNFSPELQRKVDSSYSPFTNKEALSSYATSREAHGLDKLKELSISELADKKAPLSKQSVTNAGKTMQELDSLGRTDEANQLHDLLAAKLTQSGQASQAASLLYNRTPEGLRNIALRDLRNAGVKITPKLQAEIQGHIDAIKGMPDGAAKDFATAVLQKAIAKHLPQSKIDNGLSLWKAGLLSGVKTQGGNFTSNATFAGLKKVSDVPATLADSIISLGTKERTKTLTGKGYGSGFVEGTKTGVTTMKTGVDLRNVGDKYEQHAEINLGNKVLQKILGDPANIVFRGMGAADQPWYYSALKNSLYDQAKAEGINKGLHGRELRGFMDDLVASPSDKIASTAAKEAEKAVLGHDTVAAKAINGLKQGIDNSNASTATKAAARIATNVLAPFVKVPTAFLSRTVDFTPLGLGREVFEQISNKKFDQRALSQAIGDGATGTGIIAIGMALTHKNLLSGDSPKGDAKEQARWKAEGIQPNSVKLGNKWVSLNYLGPLGLLFTAGQRMVNSEKEGASAGGQAATAMLGFGQSLLNQSFLQGFSGFSDAVQDPTKASSFINSQTGSLVPSIVNDIGNITDKKQRQVNSPTDALKARTPGLREGLDPKIDSFGNELNQASGGGLNSLNPLKPSNSVSNNLLGELDRLKSTGKDNTVFPNPVKTFNVGKDTIKLAPKEANDYNKKTGQSIQSAWNSLIKDEGYQGLEDLQKKQALESSMSDIRKLATIKFLQAKGDTAHADQLVSKLTKREIAVGEGRYGASDYITDATIRADKANKVPSFKEGAKVRYKFGSSPAKTSVAPRRVSSGGRTASISQPKPYHVKASKVSYGHNSKLSAMIASLNKAPKPTKVGKSKYA